MAEQLPRVRRPISTLALTIYALLLWAAQVGLIVALWSLARGGRTGWFLAAWAASGLVTLELHDIWLAWRRRWPTWTRWPWMREGER